MDVGRVVRQLRAVGAQAEITASGLLLGGTPTRLKVMGNRPATPSDLRRITETYRSKDDTATRPVISAKRASRQAISWLLAHPDVTLILDDQVVIDGTVHRLDDTPPAPPRSKGPPAYARYATARVLLSGAPRKDQTRLAELAGVTQGSVSNALRRIPDTRNPGARFDELVRDYPGPGGQAFYWWSRDPVNEQARRLAEHGALISGDFAADRIAPWRMSERVVAYTDAPIDLSTDGYVLADASEYTALVAVPADPTLRATARTWTGTDDVADPIIAAYDVARTATTGDQDEAVNKLRNVVVERFNNAHHHG